MTDTDLLPCPFCGGEAEMMLDGTQPDITCRGECGISYSIQVSDHFTYEERYNDPAFQWIDAPAFHYGPGGRKRAAYILTAFWNTRASTPSSTRANEQVSVEVSKLLDIRNALCNDDWFEAYHHLYTLVEWQDPYNAWAEWEKIAPEKKLTPQPSPQSEMVAVPREVIEKLRYAVTEARDTAHVFEMEKDHKLYTEALSMLQPYTKGE